MNYIHKLKPQPGRLAVVREKITEVAKTVETIAGGTVGILQPEDTQAIRSQANPFAFVVGVGNSLYGREPTALKAGMKVIISEVGRNVPLQTADGEVDWIYVLPFEGVLAILNWECPKCHAEYETEPPADACPSCPVIARPSPAVGDEALRMLAGQMTRGKRG